MGITRKIAHNGMKGRKRVTLLLVLVLAFTFLFIVSTITLETSINKTKQHQRIELYGEWKAAWMDVTEQQAQRIAEDDRVDTMSVSSILGEDENCGTIGTYSDSLAELGHFELEQGAYPKEEDEILLEANAADALGLEDPVGETITIQIIKPLVNLDRESFLKDKTQSTYRYQSFENEAVGDMNLTLRTQYCLALPSEERVSPEKILKDGYLYDQDITIKREYRISGVIASYANSWDCGNFSLANAFVTQKSGQEILEAVQSIKAADLSTFSFTQNLFLGSKQDCGELYEGLQKSYLTEEEQKETKEENSSTEALRRNTYAYPVLTGKVESTTMILVLGLIFLAASCGIFQIFLTQMKKRTRKIALLKSIGTTNGQIVTMELWEGVYLLLYSMPAGVAAGLLATKAMIAGMNAKASMDISFYLDGRLLAGGVLLGILALFLGMMIPVLYAMRVPLVGSVSVGKKKHKKENGKKKRKPLTFTEITKIHDRFNRGQVTMGRLLAFLMAVILFGCEYMAYDAFASYRSTVLLQKRPDYVLSAPHGDMDRHLNGMTEQIEEENPGVKAEFAKVAEHCFINYKNIGQSEIVNAYKKALPEDVYGNYIGVVPSDEGGMRAPKYAEELVGGSVINNVYALDTKSDYYEKIKNSITEGTFDEDGFYTGDCVILAIPLYQGSVEEVAALKEGSIPSTLSIREAMENVLKEAGMNLSYQSAYRSSYQRDTSIAPGDSIYVSQRFEAITEGSLPIDYNWVETKVGGIIYYVPGESVYPFFEHDMGYTVLASSGFMNNFCPNVNSDPTGLVWGNSTEAFQFMLEQMPTNLGKSEIYVYSGKKQQDVQEAAAVFKYARDNGYEFINYSAENWNLYYKALNAAMIIGMLGATAVVIAMIILVNINMSAFEQERPRIGVLEALGITKGEFSRMYVWTGVKNALTSLILVHVILAGILLGKTILEMGGSLSLMLDYFQYLGRTVLYQFPWKLHLFLCAGYFGIVVWNFYLPAGQLKKYSPDENINGTVK